jgi:hypothetical protein
VTIPTDAFDILNRLGHFGWISPKDRTQAQQDEVNAEVTARPRFTLPHVDVPKGTKLILTNLWKDPDVVATIGKEFTGFYQFTGSCVGVSTGNAIFTLAAIQSKLTTDPTKAFIPFWPEMYGKCRQNEGDHGQGEGAIDSYMFKTLINDGVLDAQEAGLPQYTVNDGYKLNQQLEYQWSDGASIPPQYVTAAKKYPLGSAVTCNSTADMKAAIINGYPVLDGCDDYIGHGSLQGDVALGRYDGQGGHSTCYLGYWEHDTLGPLFLYSNQWAGSTYPDDQSGKGRCCVWVKEADAARLFSLGGGGGETAALSHLTYLPAQPAVLTSLAQV